jgi:hypothetical protein
MWGGARCFVLATGTAYVYPSVLYNFSRIVKEASGAELASVDLCVVETQQTRRLCLTAEQATKLAEILKYAPRRSVMVNEDAVSLAMVFEMGRLEVRMGAADTVLVITDDMAVVNLFQNAKVRVAALPPHPRVHIFTRTRRSRMAPSWWSRRSAWLRWKSLKKALGACFPEYLWSATQTVKDGGPYKQPLGPFWDRRFATAICNV